MKGHIQVTFPSVSPEQMDILIAWLADAGFEGFEEGEHELKAFIPEDQYDRSLLRELCYKYQLNYTETRIKPENWNSLWESHFHPVIIEDFVAIRAEFHPPIPHARYEIIITPKMSFGTGHHATTGMMIKQMQDIPFAGKSVLDFGTGTGILAILAEKLGASDITAIDNDEWSIENASENIARNNCHSIHLQKAGTAQSENSFDIILANITKNIILENFALIVRQLNKNGILLLSGLMTGDEQEILNAGTHYSLLPGRRLNEGNWLCLRFLR